MKTIQILFCFILFSFVFSDDDAAKSIQDTLKCNVPNSNPSTITTQSCTSITPTLEAGGIYKGKCCKIIQTPNYLNNYKMLFKENWRQMVCQMFGLSEDLSDEEINAKIGLNQKDIQCKVITDYSQLTTLYSFSLLTIDKKVIYDCGDGETTFYSNNFVPENEEQELGKDIIDCNVENFEKDCYKRAGKLSSSLSQCCWCETNYLNQEMAAANSEHCFGYRNDEFAETLNNLQNSYSSYNLKMEYICNCYDKDGNNVRGRFNTVTGDLNVE